MYGRYLKSIFLFFQKAGKGQRSAKETSPTPGVAQRSPPSSEDLTDEDESFVRLIFLAISTHTICDIIGLKFSVLSFSAPKHGEVQRVKEEIFQPTAERTQTEKEVFIFIRY